MNTFVNAADHSNTLFPSLSIPCGSLSPDPTQLRAEPGRSGAREGWWATLLSPVHLIAYTQPLWPAPLHGANAAYILANQFFLDLQLEDILQVAGSLTWTVSVDQLHRNKSEAVLE